MRIEKIGLFVDNPASKLLDWLGSFEGITDNDGNVGGTTIRCGALALEPSYANHALKILSGPAAGQIRDTTTHPAGTDTVTVVDAFSNVAGAPQQITAGTSFIILSKTPAIAEVAAVLASLGLMADAATADDLSDVTTTSAQAKLRRILLRMSGAGVFSANIQGAARTELDTMLEQLATYFVAAGAAMALQVNGNAARTNLQQALTDYFTAFGCDGANVFNPTIQGAPRTDLDTALAQLATYFVAAGAAMALQVNNNLARTNLQQALNDYFAVVGCDGANIFSSTIQGAARTTIEGAFDGLAAYFVAAGAALSVTMNPGAGARANLQLILQDLADMLAGATGIATFPTPRALPANGVSIAEVERYIAELKPHFDTPTALTHTTVSAAPAEDTAFTTAAIGPGLLHAIFFLNNLVAGDDITFRVYQFDSVSAAYQLLSEQQFVGVQTNKVYAISGLYVDSVAHIQVRTLRTSATNRSFGSRRSIYQQPVA